MKLDGDFRITITGNTTDVMQGNHVSSPANLWYRLERLLTGLEMDVSEMNLRPWNLIIEDESDGLAGE